MPMRTAAFIGFLALALSLLGVIHFYIWARLVRDPALGPGATRVLTLLVGGLGLGIPASFFLGRVLPPDRGRTLLLVLNGWIGVMFWLFLALVVADLVGFLGLGIARLAGAPVDPDRRLFLARLAAGTLVTAAGAAATVGVASALGPVAVRDVPVVLRRLPSSLAGYTIVQLSDLHLGPTLRRPFLERIVAQVNGLAADAVVITGDLADCPVDSLRGLVAPLADLRTRQGVFFVTGNHEYYAGAEPWCQELERLGIRVLRNDRVTLGNDSATFDLAGVYDWDAARHPEAGHRMDLDTALEGRDHSREIVLLAHQPRILEEAARHEVGLVLSGHTHGGQIWPWRYFVRLQQPVVRGHFTFDGALSPVGSNGTGPAPHGTQIYVSSGTGQWGPPLRLGAPAEITRIRLFPPS
ncbi:MAG: metallophosphoesterase [Polyangiaceae bacterium]|nr:metallophosphoesterase [Polyangiaceae bacterium]